MITCQQPVRDLFIIECKDPENEKQIISEYAIEKQIERYATILKPIFTIITNDRYIIGKDLRNNSDFNYIPSLEDIINNKIKYEKAKPFIWKRCPIFIRDSKEVYEALIEIGYLSKVTKESILPNIIQLMDLFLDTKSSFKSTILSDKFILKEDLKLRLSNFGYAGSSGLIGDYRCLLLEDKNGNCRILGYSIYRQGSRGTYLSISVDNRKGLALELQLDKFLTTIGTSEYQIIHNGAMAVGHKGSIKPSVVLEYVKKNAPFLIENGKVLLGTFKLNKHLKFQHKEVQDFILRTATYAILREELRGKL